MKNILVVLVLALVSQASLADIKSEFESNRAAMKTRSELSAQQNLKLALAKLRLEVVGVQELGGFMCGDGQGDYFNCSSTWYKQMYMKLADGRICHVDLVLSGDFTGLIRSTVNVNSTCVKNNVETANFGMVSVLDTKTKLYSLVNQFDQKSN